MNAQRSNRRGRSEEHTSELQSPCNLVCRLLLEKNSTAIAFGQETDRAGYKDYPGISGVPVFILREYGDCVETAFDAHNFFFFKNRETTQISALSQQDDLRF